MSTEAHLFAGLQAPAARALFVYVVPLATDPKYRRVGLVQLTPDEERQAVDGASGPGGAIQEQTLWSLRMVAVAAPTPDDPSMVARSKCAKAGVGGGLDVDIVYADMKPALRNLIGSEFLKLHTARNEEVAAFQKSQTIEVA